MRLVSVIYDERSARNLVFVHARAAQRFSPASTFMLCNAMATLDSGAVGDEHEVIRWDGVKRPLDIGNRDHSLASGTNYPVVWFQPEVTRRPGRARMEVSIVLESHRAGRGSRQMNTARDVGGWLHPLLSA